MKVSKREAFLLFILAFIGIIGMMTAFVILPLLGDLDANKAILSELESRKLVIDTTLPNEAALQAQHDTKLEEVSTLLHAFESPINEAQFERWVLPLTSKYNMRVTNTDFVEVSATTPKAIDTVPSEVYYSIRDLVDKYHAVVKEELAVPETSSLLMLSQHTYDVNTTYARYVYFLDAVRDWNTSILISNSSYNFEEATASYTFDLFALHQLLPDDIEVDYTPDIIAGGTGKGDPNEDPHPEGGK